MAVNFWWLCVSVGSYDKCVHTLRETYKDNMATQVTAAIFSHTQVAKKNTLVIALIVSNACHTTQGCRQGALSLYVDILLHL